MREPYVYPGAVERPGRAPEHTLGQRYGTSHGGAEVWLVPDAALEQASRVVLERRRIIVPEPMP